MKKSYCYDCRPINLLFVKVDEKWRGKCKIHGNDVLRYTLPETLPVEPKKTNAKEEKQIGFPDF